MEPSEDLLKEIAFALADIDTASEADRDDELDALLEHSYPTLIAQNS